MDTLFDLPNDCWQNICEYLSLESASVLYFVSKSFRRLHALFMASYFNRVHGLSTDVVPFLPASVARATSSIGVLLLFEKAVCLAETKNYVELAETLKKLLYRAEMVAVTNYVQKNMPYNLIDKRHLKSVCYTDFCYKNEYVLDYTDSSTCSTTQRSEFIWVGKDRHYIAVKCEHHDLYTHGDGQGWLNFKVTVALKQLGVDNYNETIVFQFEKDPKNDDGTHVIDECIFYSDSSEAKEFLMNDDIRKIVDWLKVDLIGENSSKNFMKVLLGLAVRQWRYRGEDSNKIKPDDYNEDNTFAVVERDEQVERMAKKYYDEIKDLNGNMAQEIARLMQFYLSGSNPWNLKVQFVLKRILRKLAFIQCINKSNFSSDEARKELLDLFGRAYFLICDFENVQFEVPKTSYHKKRLYFSKKQNVGVVLKQRDKDPVTMYFDVTYEGNPGDFNSSFVVQISSVAKKTRSFWFCIDTFKSTFAAEESIREHLNGMNLQHVTENDWAALFLAYMEPPSAEEMQIYVDYDIHENDEN